MDQNWYIYYDDNWLNFCRAFTGACIFKVKFAPTHGGHKIVEAWASRDSAQYTNKEEKEDQHMITSLIYSLLLNKPVPPSLHIPGYSLINRAGQRKKLDALNVLIRIIYTVIFFGVFVVVMLSAAFGVEKAILDGLPRGLIFGPVALLMEGAIFYTAAIIPTFHRLPKSNVKALGHLMPYAVTIGATLFYYSRQGNLWQAIHIYSGPILVGTIIAYTFYITNELIREVNRQPKVKILSFGVVGLTIFVQGILCLYAAFYLLRIDFATIALYGGGLVERLLYFVCLAETLYDQNKLLNIKPNVRTN